MKKIATVFLVLVLGYSIIPHFHVSITHPDQAYEPGDSVVFTISNNSLFDGRVPNVGWAVQRKTGGDWVTFMEPSPYIGGLLYGFSRGSSHTQRISLKEADPGEYRYGRDVQVLGFWFRVYTRFTVQ